jgi:hypothetical protein
LAAIHLCSVVSVDAFSLLTSLLPLLSLFLIGHFLPQVYMLMQGKKKGLSLLQGTQQVPDDQTLKQKVLSLGRSDYCAHCSRISHSSHLAFLPDG